MRLTKYQQRCWELAQELPALSDKQYAHATKTVPAFRVIHYRKEYCSECGGVIKGDKCTVCGHDYMRDHHSLRARGKIALYRIYYGIDTTIGGEQVTRHFIIEKRAKVGEAPSFNIYEVSRDFVSEKGWIAVQQRDVSHNNWYYDKWLENTPIRPKQIRSPLSLYNPAYERSDIQDYAMWPHSGKAAWLRKRGYRGIPAGFGSISWKRKMATEPFAEWLCKRKHLSWLDKCPFHKAVSVKREAELADKHGYRIKDFLMWADMVLMYRELGFDTLNGKWSRPTDLKAAHDLAAKMVDNRHEREMRRLELERQEAQIRDAMAHKEEYNRRMEPWSGTVVVGSGLFCTPIIDLDSLIEEGKTMHHCVASYWNESASIIFSVQDFKGSRLATVEFSLDEGRVVQCRGDHNSTPGCYDAVMALFHYNKERLLKVTAAQ